jgi:hypothetical protein
MKNVGNLEGGIAHVQSYRFPDIASNVPSVGAEVSQSV